MRPIDARFYFSHGDDKSPAPIPYSTKANALITAYEAGGKRRQLIAGTIMAECADPQKFETIRAALKNHLAAADSSSLPDRARLAAVESLLAKVETEYLTPNARIRLRLERHDVADSTKNQETVDGMVEEMKKVLKIGEKNVIFIEDADGDSAAAVYAAANAKAKAGMPFQRAFLHSVFYGDSFDNYNPDDLDAKIKQFKTPEEIQQSGNTFLLNEAVERILAAGYSATIISEKGEPTYIPDVDLTNYDDYVRLHEFLIRTRIPREKRIAQQIQKIIAEEGSGGKVNLHMFLGANHAGIINQFPRKFLPIIELSQQDPSEWDLGPKCLELNLRMQQGKQIPRALYWEAYNENLNRLRNST